MMQIAEQNYEEKVEMYMKLKKKELVQMLIECNKQLNTFIKNRRISCVKVDDEAVACDDTIWF
jgi:hypothetical protein